MLKVYCSARMLEQCTYLCRTYCPSDGSLYEERVSCGSAQEANLRLVEMVILHYGTHVEMYTYSDYLLNVFNNYVHKSRGHLRSTHLGLITKLIESGAKGMVFVHRRRNDHSGNMGYVRQGDVT